jgi:hypothetical protein
MLRPGAGPAYSSVSVRLVSLRVCDAVYAAEVGEVQIGFFLTNPDKARSELRCRRVKQGQGLNWAEC